MIVVALSDAVVCTHCSCVDLCGASLSVCSKLLFLDSSRFNDCSEFLFLCIEVLVSYGDLLLYNLKFGLLVEDALLCLVDVLFCNLSQETLVLDFLVE